MSKQVVSLNLNESIKELPADTPCTRCKGTGKLAAYGNTIPERDCYKCNGAGKFNRPDLDAIYMALQGRKGIRTAKPKDNNRAAYVWRMYRFHSGIDVTLPVMASFDIDGDPYAKLLDQFASVLAQKFTGSDTVGASRWAKALGYV